MGFKGPTPKREERKGWAMGGKKGSRTGGEGKRREKEERGGEGMGNERGRGGFD